MKNLFLSIFLFLPIAFLTGQSPDSLSFQAVIRGEDGTLLINQTVSVKIGIIQGTTDGTKVFEEIHSVTTNENGLLTLIIGNGTIEHGSFGNIDWGDGPYFIKREIDPSGGNNYVISGVSQFLSVPYALYAASGGSADNMGNHIASMELDMNGNRITDYSIGSNGPNPLKMGVNLNGQDLIIESYRSINLNSINGNGLNDPNNSSYSESGNINLNSQKGLINFAEEAVRISGGQSVFIGNDTAFVRSSMIDNIVYMKSVDDVQIEANGNVNIEAIDTMKIETDNQLVISNNPSFISSGVVSDGDVGVSSLNDLIFNAQTNIDLISEASSGGIGVSSTDSVNIMADKTLFLSGDYNIFLTNNPNYWSGTDDDVFIYSGDDLLIHSFDNIELQSNSGDIILNAKGDGPNDIELTANSTIELISNFNTIISNDTSFIAGTDDDVTIYSKDDLLMTVADNFEITSNAGDVRVQSGSDIPLIFNDDDLDYIEIWRGPDSLLYNMPNTAGEQGRFLILNGIHTTGNGKQGNIGKWSEYSLPLIDGTAGFVLQTNGNGTVSWVNPTALSQIPIPQKNQSDFQMLNEKTKNLDHIIQQNISKIELLEQRIANQNLLLENQKKMINEMKKVVEELMK
jgi:uncharacterized protein (DUF2345 family)